MSALHCDVLKQHNQAINVIIYTIDCDEQHNGNKSHVTFNEFTLSIILNFAENSNILEYINKNSFSRCFFSSIELIIVHSHTLSQRHRINRNRSSERQSYSETEL